MDQLNWCLQTSPANVKRMLVSEYILNDMGIFIKDEYRMPKSDVLTTITGFRIGYNNIPNTDYHAAPGSRKAILWYKITDISEEAQNCLLIKGNQSDVIRMVFHLEDRDQILDYIASKLQAHPTVFQEDKAAAGWLCWRDDDEWEEPYGSLESMIEEEMAADRFVEDVLEDTVLNSTGNLSVDQFRSLPSQASEVEKEAATSQAVNKRPNYCWNCGNKLDPEGNFCHNCGTAIH